MRGEDESNLVNVVPFPSLAQSFRPNLNEFIVMMLANFQHYYYLPFFRVHALANIVRRQIAPLWEWLAYSTVPSIDPESKPCSLSEKDFCSLDLFWMFYFTPPFDVVPGDWL